jgi:hypothetical protein
MRAEGQNAGEHSQGFFKSGICSDLVALAKSVELVELLSNDMPRTATIKMLSDMSLMIE